MDYVAVIFDVVDSRRYDNRYEVQKILLNSIEYLNDIYCHYLKKEVVPSAGDEFQGLFYDLQSAFSYVRKMQLLFYPIKIRCGIGKGGIKYYERNWQSSAIDGETYYLARDAIDAIPNRGSNIICYNTGSVYDKYLNIYHLSAAEIKNRQSQMVRYIELLADILNPVQVKNGLMSEHPAFYSYILAMKRMLMGEWSYSASLTLRQSRSMENINSVDVDFLFSSKKVYDDNISNGTLYPNEFWERGMSTVIAKALNMTRQNLERYIILGRIKESRNMDGAILSFLGEKVWQI